MKNSVAAHYTHGQLLDRIVSGVEAIGKTAATVTVDELAPVDEFHIGGRQASEDFISQLELSADDHTLDVGCGIGGTSRFVASRFGCRVTGIDLTPEFVSTGQSLCDRVGLSGQVELHQGDATVNLRQSFFQKHAGEWNRHVAIRHWVCLSPWMNPHRSRSATWWITLPLGASHRSRSSLSSDLNQKNQIVKRRLIRRQFDLSMESDPKGTCLKIFATEAHGNTRKKNALLYRIFPCNSVCFRG